VDQPLQIHYPDKDSPGVIIKLGRKVDRGVGPDADIVAFSTLCPHKGYPLGHVRGRKDPQLSWALFALRLRERRPGDVAMRHRTCRSSGCALPPMATSSPTASKGREEYPELQAGLGAASDFERRRENPIQLLQRQTLDRVILVDVARKRIDCDAEASGFITIFLFKGVDLFGRHWPRHRGEL
jgi:hypothetical protein